MRWISSSAEGSGRKKSGGVEKGLSGSSKEIFGVGQEVVRGPTFCKQSKSNKLATAQQS